MSYAYNHVTVASLYSQTMTIEDKYEPDVSADTVSLSVKLNKLIYFFTYKVQDHAPRHPSSV